MFKGIIGCIGFFVVAVFTVRGEMTLYGVAYKLWSVVFISWVLGGILDTAFLCFYEDAIRRLTPKDAK